MREFLLKELLEISDEEQRYLDGETQILRDLYTKGELGEIDREQLLKSGSLVTVRPHSRFIDFPEHRHNYIEMMYVVQGSITHNIENKELKLQKGDVLLLNQHVKHSIKKAQLGDIGINFIALPEFFEIPLSMLREENVLADFVVGTLRQKNQGAQYLLFRMKENPFVENLMENMITSMLHDNKNEDITNQYSMGLVFLYLLNNIEESLNRNSSFDYKEAVVRVVLNCINADCKNANLTKIAKDCYQSVTVLSKLIKQKTGYNFQELLQRKRFGQAVQLLLDTNLSIEEISVAVGYENQSYFYRQFRQRYGMTPRKYRIKHKGDAQIHI